MSAPVIITANGLNEAQAEILALVSPKNRLRANKIGARAAQQALKAYHRTKGRKLWTTPGPTHGPGRQQSGWYKQVAAAWGTENVTADGASMVNGANYFAHKVRGGEIRAKRVKFLTIPLIPEAHGKTVQQFKEEENVGIFRSKSGKALLMAKKGKVTAVFALKQRVMQKPTPGALPNMPVYLVPFEEAMINAILED